MKKFAINVTIMAALATSVCYAAVNTQPFDPVGFVGWSLLVIWFTVLLWVNENA